MPTWLLIVLLCAMALALLAVAAAIYLPPLDYNEFDSAEDAKLRRIVREEIERRFGGGL